MLSGVDIAGNSRARAIACHPDLGIHISKFEHMHTCTCTCNAVSCSSYTHSHMHMHVLDKHVGVHALYVDVHNDDVVQHVWTQRS